MSDNGKGPGLDLNLQWAGLQAADSGSESGSTFSYGDLMKTASQLRKAVGVEPAPLIDETIYTSIRITGGEDSPSYLAGGRPGSDGNLLDPPLQVAWDGMALDQRRAQKTALGNWLQYLPPVDPGIGSDGMAPSYSFEEMCCASEVRISRAFRFPAQNPHSCRSDRCVFKVPTRHGWTTKEHTDPDCGCIELLPDGMAGAIRWLVGQIAEADLYADDQIDEIEARYRSKVDD